MINSTVRYESPDSGVTLHELNQFVLACQEANLPPETTFKVGSRIRDQRLQKIENR